LSERDMGHEVVIDRVLSRVHIVPGPDGISEEMLRRILAAILPAVQEMLDHQRRVGDESGTGPSYADRIGGHGL
jgi:hypothetical protein